jgi:hypothetical protein
MSSVRQHGEFFDLLLEIESNIPAVAPAMVDYWAVERPGRLRRSFADGRPVPERITFGEFLARTGVAERYGAGSATEVRAARFAVMNPWGFVGYQFGEALLIDLDYYRPAVEDAVVDGRTEQLPSYYASAPAPSTWRHGRTRLVFHDEDARIRRVGTDVNEWSGTFTGKDGLRSLADLRTEAGQLAVLRSSLRRNAEIVDRHLRSHDEDLWSPVAGRPGPAAVLAACHLCGPWAVTAWLSDGAVRRDEAGTALTTYLKRFSQVPLTVADIA